MRRRDSKSMDLRAQLSKALEAGQMEQALEFYELIEKQKPDEPRWSHRKGDLLRRMGREADAVRAYERAVELYAARGFDARAVATAKVMLAIDPNRGEVLEQVDPEAARRFINSAAKRSRVTFVIQAKRMPVDPQPPTRTVAPEATRCGRRAGEEGKTGERFCASERGIAAGHARPSRLGSQSRGGSTMRCTSCAIPIVLRTTNVSGFLEERTAGRFHWFNLRSHVRL